MKYVRIAPSKPIIFGDGLMVKQRNNKDFLLALSKKKCQNKKVCESAWVYISRQTPFCLEETFNQHQFVSRHLGVKLSIHRVTLSMKLKLFCIILSEAVQVAICLALWPKVT